MVRAYFERLRGMSWETHKVTCRFDNRLCHISTHMRTTSSCTSATASVTNTSTFKDPNLECIIPSKNTCKSCHCHPRTPVISRSLLLNSSIRERFPCPSAATGATYASCALSSSLFALLYPPACYRANAFSIVMHFSCITP